MSRIKDKILDVAYAKIEGKSNLEIMQEYDVDLEFINSETVQETITLLEA